MPRSPYDLTPEDMQKVRERAAKLVEANGMYANPVDIVLLAMHQVVIIKWMEQNPRPGKESGKSPKPKKPNLSSLFE